MRARAAGWAAGWVMVLQGACAAPRPAPRPGVPAPVEARLVSGGRDCQGRPTAVMPALAREAAAVAEALRAQGVRVLAAPIEDPDADGVRRTLAAPATGPILWIYTGHGDLVHPGARTLLSDAEKESPTRVAASALCLADGPMRIEEVVAALPRSAPFALLIVNACFSADADIRAAPIDMSLISLSTWKTKLIAGERTPIGDALRATTLRALDRDCDHAVSDVELYAHLRDRFVSETYGAPILKLRRQSRRLPALWDAVGCHPDLPVDAVAADLHIEPYRHFGLWRALVSGYLPVDAPIELGSRMVPAGDLQATYCRADIGQCFQPRTPL